MLENISDSAGVQFENTAVITQIKLISTNGRDFRSGKSYERNNAYRC